MSKLRVDFFVQFVQFFFGKNKIANQELVLFFVTTKTQALIIYRVVTAHANLGETMRTLFGPGAFALPRWLKDRGVCFACLWLLILVFL